MNDLQTQLAQYGVFHEEEQEPLTVEEILAGLEGTPVIPLPTPPGRGARQHGEPWRRVPAEPSSSPWAIVAAAILLVLLLAAIPLWLTGGGVDPVEPAPPVTTTVPAPPKIESAWPAIEPADLNMDTTSLGTLRWTRVSGDVDTLPAGPLEPAPSGDGFVVHDVESRRVWVSTDGLVWERDPDAVYRVPGVGRPLAVSDDGAGWSLPDSIFPEGGTIFATDFGWVATAMPQSEHVFAISSDGERWEAVLPPPGPPSPSGEGTAGAGAAGDLLYVFLSEVESGSRTVWIGSFDDGEYQPPDSWPAIEPTVLDRSETSLGTLSWTRVSGDAETLPGASIVADGEGTYWAGDRGGGVWRSVDGLHWERGDDVAELPDERIGPLGFETNFGFVEMSMPQSRHLISLSADGETWEEVLGPPGSHEPVGDGIAAAGAAGDLIWVLVAENSGPRTLWIARFDE